jgi:hypothetical protein
MTDIVAGRFAQQATAQAAIDRLLQHGFRRDDVSSFFVNPPGQHARHSMGGDRDVSPGARGAGRGAVVGAIIGAVLGLLFGLAAVRAYGLAAPIAGAVAGAYLGALAGALARLQDPPRSRPVDGGATEVRPAGIMVAAHTPTAWSRDEALRTLRSSGAAEVEAAQGEWHDGEWTDFDPTTPPSPAVARRARGPMRRGR